MRKVAATGWALEAQRKRKEEEARARAEAAAANARAEAREAEERRRQAEAAWRRKQEEEQEKRDAEMRQQQQGTDNSTGGPMWEHRFLVSKPFQRLVKDDGIPDQYVEIPPLTPNQYVALRNSNVAAQVGTYGVTTGIGVLLGSAIGVRTTHPVIGVAITVVGAIAGAMWGAYEVSCLTSVQAQFDTAYQTGKSVRVWRQGWKYNVHGGSETYAHVNAPISAAYVATVTLLLTGKLP